MTDAQTLSDTEDISVSVFALGTHAAHVLIERIDCVRENPLIFIMRHYGNERVANEL